MWSPYSLYSEDIVTFNEGEGYQQSDATGFIRLLGLPTRIQASVNARNRRDRKMLTAVTGIKWGMKGRTGY